jgi:glutathione-regulated potassium-efflux system ancillary protein KefG
MKTIVIVAHPNITNSRVNSRWVEELNKHTEIAVHELYKEYPDEKIDVQREQALLLEHDRIVLQFPFYWYSSPSLLKKWQDEVLTYGWAYGSKGDKLHGKELMLAISTGGPAAAYRAGGFNHYTMSELTKPFQATSNLIGTKFLPSFVLNGIGYLSDEDIANSAREYVKAVQGVPVPK